jgi:Family of unknown function (DUF6152)
MKLTMHLLMAERWPDLENRVFARRRPTRPAARLRRGRTLGETMKASVAICGVFFLSSIASAHHAFSANYDANRSGTVAGTVEEVFWANPHVHYYLRVKSADGSIELWDVEWSNLNGMSGRGWNRDTVRVGDEIRVTGKMGRDENHRITPGEIVRTDGKPLP